MHGYLGPTVRSKSFGTKVCHDRFGTYRRTSDMAPSTSISTGQCKTKTADWRPGIKCRLRVKCRLQTTDYRLFKYISTVLFPLSISNRKQFFRLIAVKVCNAPVSLNITQVGLNNAPVCLFTVSSQ